MNTTIQNQRLHAGDRVKTRNSAQPSLGTVIAKPRNEIAFGVPVVLDGYGYVTYIVPESLEIVR